MDHVSDSAQRSEEWIHFYLMVGMNHVYVYDNSPVVNNATFDDADDLKHIPDTFGSDKVTYHRWTAQVCNNYRPADKNPGERSSQYAAEASCRERYGPLTEWMVFLDTDEYLVPMKHNLKGEYTWNTVLDEMDQKNISVLKFRPSRGKLRVDLMEYVRVPLLF
jgi:hypothetical protein